MTRDDVIRMARDAGSSPYTNRHIPERPFHTFSPEALERFAALVAAHEREAQPVQEPVDQCRNCNGSGYMVRDPDIGTDQECFVCDGSGIFSDHVQPRGTHEA